MKEAFIFDMDGVIIDSEPIHIRLDKIMFNELGINIEEHELEKYIGVTNEHMWSDLIKKHNIDKSLEWLLNRALELKLNNLANEDIEPIEGIRELLKQLKSLNFKTAVASSSPLSYINAVLEKFQIKSYFDIIVSGEQVSNSKPAPDIFIKAANLLGVSESDCIVLEDSTNGVRAAKAANMLCIGFNNVNSKNQDIGLADYKVDSIFEVVDLLEQIVKQ